MLSCSLVLVLETKFDDVLEDELESLGELDVRADAFMRRFPDGGLAVKTIKWPLALTDHAKYIHRSPPICQKAAIDKKKNGTLSQSA